MARLWTVFFFMGELPCLRSNSTSLNSCSILGASSFLLHARVMENAPPGTVIHIIKAINPAAVTLTSRTHEYVGLNAVDKEVYVRKQVKINDSVLSLQFPFWCTDGSEKVYYMMAISIDDDNDNPPVFTHQNYILYVTKDVPKFSLLNNTVQATDADIVGDSKHIYYRVEGEYSSYFCFPWRNNSTLKLLTDLSTFVSAEKVTLLIIAENRPKKELNASAYLTIFFLGYRLESAILPLPESANYVALTYFLGVLAALLILITIATHYRWIINKESDSELGSPSQENFEHLSSRMSTHSAPLAPLSMQLPEENLTGAAIPEERLSIQLPEINSDSEAEGEKADETLSGSEISSENASSIQESEEKRSDSEN